MLSIRQATGVIAFIILGFVLLTNPMSNTSLQTRYFTIKIPTDWKIKTDTPGSITEKNTIFKIISKTKIISKEFEVIKVVEQFGRRLKEVNLLAPKEICRNLIKENYSKYISPELLSEWLEDPSKAPGRYGSSPWPDRIEIKDITKVKKNKFFITGNIVEITSVPGEEWRTGITLTVEKLERKWLITEITLFEKDENANGFVKRLEKTTLDSIASHHISQ